MFVGHIIIVDWPHLTLLNDAFPVMDTMPSFSNTYTRLCKPPPPKMSPSVHSSENVGPVFKALIPESFRVNINNENEYGSQTINFNIITSALPSPFALKGAAGTCPGSLGRWIWVTVW